MNTEYPPLPAVRLSIEEMGAILIALEKELDAVTPDTYSLALYGARIAILAKLADVEKSHDR